MIEFDLNVRLSTSLISQKLCGQLYTIKQDRVEPSTCNSVVNIEKSRVFAEELIKHEREGAFIVYYDETSFNLYCRRSQGRAKKGCFSVLKAKIKNYLAQHHYEMLNVPRGQMQERRMQVLERAAEACLPCMTLRLVNRMARHCAHAVAAATRSEEMEYGK